MSDTQADRNGAAAALLEKMRADWNGRALVNAHHYIVDYQTEWSKEDFYQSGRQSVAEYILTDLGNIGACGLTPDQMHVLEIGCGAGRVTRALSEVFGAVDAVDISAEMVRLARTELADRHNVRVFQNNGQDLDVLGDTLYDFGFSMCVFHHIPSKAVIEEYVRQVGSRLKPGALFKFEVQGYLEMTAEADDTWLGTPLSTEEMLAMADRCGFEPRYSVGAGEERFWHWFFKKA